MCFSPSLAFGGLGYSKESSTLEEEELITEESDTICMKYKMWIKQKGAICRQDLPNKGEGGEARNVKRIPASRVRQAFLVMWPKLVRPPMLGFSLQDESLGAPNI